MRWSLRTKIFLVLSTLLLAVILAYLAMAEHVFRQDKELLIFDMNRSAAAQVANELDASLRRVVDKMELLAELAPSDQGEEIFDQDPELLVFQLVSPSRPGKRGEGRVFKEWVSEKKLEDERIPFDFLKGTHVLPSPPVTPEEEMVVENRSIPNAVFYFIRIPVKVTEGGKERMLYAQALIDGRDWLDHFRHPGLSLNFVVAKDGIIFAHPSINEVLTHQSANDLELIQAATSNPFTIRQMEFEHDGKTYLGVYRKMDLGGLIVVSMIDKAAALAASRQLLEKTLLLSLIIVTVVLLISLFFASSVSVSVLKLVAATREVAQGNLDTPIQVSTTDEIGILASAFQKMTKALKEQRQALIAQEQLAAVGRLSRSVGHEFGNVLQPLVTKLEVAKDLLERGDAEAVRPLVDEMIEAAMLGANISQDLLIFAKERPAEIAEALPSVLLASAIQRALRLVRHELKKKDIKLDISLQPDVQIQGALPRLVQVFVNLFANSLSAMSDGGRLCIADRVEGERIRVTVTDTGSGVAYENIEHLFQPLFTTKTVRGNGLGLTVCKQIVEGYGGKISISSPGVGQGATVTLEFPICYDT